MSSTSSHASPISLDSYINKPAPQLFPAARAMEQAPTTTVPGIVPGVNTLVPPAFKQAQKGPASSSPVAAAHNLTEDEVLKQKEFATQLFGPSVGVMDVPVLAPNLADDGNQDFAMDNDRRGMAQKVNFGVGPRQKRLLPTLHQESKLPDQHMPSGEQFNFQPLDPSRDISNLEMGNFMSSNINNESGQVFYQHCGQQEKIAQQQFQGGMDLNFQPGLYQQNFDFGDEQPHFDIDERKRRKSGGSWSDREENTTVIRGTVKGAFGKWQQTPQMPASSRPGLLGPYPGVPLSDAVVSSTPSANSSLQLQPNFKETLRDLSPVEKEMLRKALLSGKTESPRLTSNQTLEILQALKSVTSDGQESKTSGSKSGQTPTVGTSTQKESRHQISSSKSSNQHRGLGSILEVLRSSEQVDEWPSKEHTSLRSHSQDRFGDTDTRNGPGRVNTNLSRSAERERERDRDRRGNRERGRDDVRGDGRRSPHRENNRSRSRERNFRDGCGFKDRRNRRFSLNNQRGPQAQSGWTDRDGPDQKRRRLDDAQRPNQDARTPTWSQRKGDDYQNRRSRENERSDASTKRSQEEKKSSQGPFKPQHSKPVPLLDVVIPPSAQRPSLDLGSSKKTPPKQASAKTDTTDSQKQGSGSKAETSNDKTVEIKKKKKVEEKLTTEEAKKVAATMKPSTLLEQICDGSTQHQLNLLKEIGLDGHVKDKEIVDWYCYVCGKFCTGWSIYMSHIEGRKHKGNFRRLHQPEHAAVKETLIRKLADLPNKSHGAPHHYSDIPHPSFAVQPPLQTIITSTPLGRNDQAFFCGKCFRTYICSYEEHIASDDHKKFMEIRPKCTLCKLTFFNQKALRSHVYKISHIRKAKDKGVNPYKMDGKNVEPESKDEEEEEEKEKITSEKTNISGTEFIVPVTGYYCKLCGKFYEKEQAAKEVHCGTLNHGNKVKQYYAKHCKSSGLKKSGDKAKSGDEQDPTLPSSFPPSKDVQPKNILAKKDAAPKKDVTTAKDDSTKGSAKKDTSTKDATSQKVLAKKDDTATNDAPLKMDESAKKSVSTRESPPIKDSPPTDEAASTKEAPPTNESAKKSTKEAPPKDESVKKETSAKKPTKDSIPTKDARPIHSEKRRHSTNSDKIDKSPENTPKENELTELCLKEPKLVLSIPKISPSTIAAIEEANAKALRERKLSSSDDAKPERQTSHQEHEESDTSDSQEQKSALDEMDINSEFEVEGEWEGELPDFDNLISVDEVGEVDEEEM